MTFTAKDLAHEINVADPQDTYSFIRGFRAACALFGIWKDGEKFLGIGEVTMSDINHAIIEYDKGQG